MNKERMQKKEANTVIATEQTEVAAQVGAKAVSTEKTGDEAAKETGLLRDNRGVGVVEIILILVVLIALVVIFKDQLTSMVSKAMASLEASMNQVLP